MKNVLKVLKITGITLGSLLVLFIVLTIYYWRSCDRAAEEKRIAEKTAAIVAKEAKIIQEQEAQEKKEAVALAEKQLREKSRWDAVKLYDNLNQIEKLVSESKCRELKPYFVEFSLKIKPYETLVPFPILLAQVMQKYRSSFEWWEKCSSVFWAIEDFKSYKDQAENLAIGKVEDVNWENVIESLEKAEEQLTILMNVSKEFKKFIPKSFNIKKEKKFIKKWTSDANAYGIYMLLCGEKTSVRALEYALKIIIKRTAHDPGSISVKNCTSPILSKENCWVTQCDVRGKNAFGAMILNRKTYSINSLTALELD